MVKLSAPALSLDASGKLGNSIVFSKWKGRNYARILVTPANPKSGGQVGVRAMMKFLSQYWASLSSVEQADWQTRADQTTISPFNAFVGYNMSRWRSFLAPSKLDPATEDGASLTMAPPSATGGVRQITLSVEITALQQNWGIMWFRSATTPLTPAFANCIAVIPAESAATFTYVDTPLDPGTYYYNLRGFSKVALLGGFANEFDGTAT